MNAPLRVPTRTRTLLMIASSLISSLGGDIYYAGNVHWTARERVYFRPVPAHHSGQKAKLSHSPSLLLSDALA